MKVSNINNNLGNFSFKTNRLAIDIADAKKDKYLVDLENAQYYCSLLPAIPFCIAIGLLSGYQKLAKHPMAARTVCVLTALPFLYFSLWRADKENLSKKASINSAVNNEFSSNKIFADISKVQEEQINKKAATYSKFNKEKLDISLIVPHLKNPFKFLKKIKQEAKEDVQIPSNSSFDTDTIKTLENLNFETEKYTHKLTSGINFTSALLAGTSILMAYLAKKNKNNIFTWFAFVPLFGAGHLLTKPYLNEAEIIGRYKAKEKMFNNNEENEPKNPIMFMIKHFNNRKSNLKKAMEQNSYANTKKSLLDSIELTPEQNEAAQKNKEKFINSAYLVQQKEQLLNMNKVRYPVRDALPVVLISMFSLQTLKKSNYHFMKLLSLSYLAGIAGNAIIDQVEYNKYKNSLTQF